MTKKTVFIFILPLIIALTGCLKGSNEITTSEFGVVEYHYERKLFRTDNGVLINFDRINKFETGQRLNVSMTLDIENQPEEAGNIYLQATNAIAEKIEIGFPTSEEINPGFPNDNIGGLYQMWLMLTGEKPGRYLITVGGVYFRASSKEHQLELFYKGMEKDKETELTRLTYELRHSKGTDTEKDRTDSFVKSFDLTERVNEYAKEGVPLLFRIVCKLDPEGKEKSYDIKVHVK